MLNPKAEQAVELAGEIAQLRTVLKTKEDELNQLVSTHPGAVRQASPPKTKHHEKHPRRPWNPETYKPVPGSIADQIIKLLDGAGGKTMPAEEIGKALGIENVNSLRGTLNRLTSFRKIKKPGRGAYKSAA